LIIAYDHRKMVRTVLKPTQGVIGRRLRQARLAADMTQEALGVALGLDEGVACIRISRYESGVHSPGFDVLPKLAQALGVPIAYLVTEDDRWAQRQLAMHRLAPEQLRGLDEWLGLWRELGNPLELGGPEP
jgi:transcriptional regulator with XRE-family HTH domain